MDEKTLEKKEDVSSANDKNPSFSDKFLKSMHNKNLEIEKKEIKKDTVIMQPLKKADEKVTPENKVEAKKDTIPLGKNLINIILTIKNLLKNSILKIKSGFSREKKKHEAKSEDKKKYSNKELMQEKKKKDKIVVSRYEHKRHLKEYLEKAGYTVNDETKISKRVNIVSFILVTILSFYLIYTGLLREDKLIFILTQIILSWVIILPSLIVIFWVIFYFIIDFKIFNRRKELEEVLPDFLQLTSANINAGMPLDQALWYAVKPRFGILAKEIEEVAKSTLVGEDLGDALDHFSKRYDSLMLKRTVNLMLEGLDAGGEIGPLLNKIAVDIQETRLIKKDMAANVTTYVIFISFATLVAAPFLFALSNQLLSIIQSLVSNINVPQQAAGGSMMSMSFSKDAISMANFKIFAVSSLVVTSFFSAVIISTIRYGNVKEGIKYLPIFIIISVIIYFIATNILGYFMGGII